eukprot:gene16060-21809_t
MVIAQPESFPNPTIRRATIRRVNLFNSVEDALNGQIQPISTINALESGSGMFYEMGRKLKDAIFGCVIFAMKLDRVNEDRFVRSPVGQRAIKVYSKAMLRQLQGQTQENPLNEITALQFIGDNHPNLMGQIECCTDDSNIYSIMRFVKGGELYERVDEEGPMNEQDAKIFFKQLMCGLDKLQSDGIGHRDMSLENILFDEENFCFIIIDFGMCLRKRKNPSLDGSFCQIPSQVICGKKNYISPEVANSHSMGIDSFDPCLSDMWAAGIILFILTTGVPAVEKATDADDRFRMICDNKLGFMLQHWGMDLSKELVDVIQNMLRRDPQQRLTISQVL